MNFRISLWNDCPGSICYFNLSHFSPCSANKLSLSELFPRIKLCFCQKSLFDYMYNARIGKTSGWSMYAKCLWRNEAFKGNLVIIKFELKFFELITDSSYLNICLQLQFYCWNSVCDQCLVAKYLVLNKFQEQQSLSNYFKKNFYYFVIHFMVTKNYGLPVISSEFSLRLYIWQGTHSKYRQFFSCINTDK